MRDVPDFPAAGVLFRDITPVLQDGHLLRDLVRHLAARYEASRLDAIAAIEARGFIFGAAVAAQLGVGFVPIRKPGKLPHHTTRVEYTLEYGTDCIEVHEDAFQPGQRILVLDDLLATGGTAAAAVELVRLAGAEAVGAAFLIELSFLHGRARLEGLDTWSLLAY